MLKHRPLQRRAAKEKRTGGLEGDNRESFVQGILNLRGDGHKGRIVVRGLSGRHERKRDDHGDVDELQSRSRPSLLVTCPVGLSSPLFSRLVSLAKSRTLSGFKGTSADLCMLPRAARGLVTSGRCSSASSRLSKPVKHPSATRGSGGIFFGIFLLRRIMSERQPWYIAAIDQGTSSTRVVVYDQDGKNVAFHQVPLPLITPKPGYAMKAFRHRPFFA